MDRGERRRRVVALHGEGESIRGIARRLGIGVATVHRDLKADGVVRPANLPPAELGNTRAMTHGLDSDRVTGAVIEPRARELLPGIVDAHGHLDAGRDGPAVLRYALCLARLEHAYGWLAQQGDELFSDRKAGKVHGLLGRVARWEAQAGREEERLAISPRERTRLKLDQVRGQLLLAGGALDLAALSDDELAEYRRLAAKATGTIEGTAS
jgi:hypothetical protein